MNGTAASILGAIAIPLFGFLGIIANGVFKVRTEAHAARREVTQAHNSITAIESNTQPLSEGFPERTDEKLDRLLRLFNRLEERLTRVETAQMNHLEWHMQQERKRK